MDPLRVAILASRSAAGIVPLLADPNRGSTWELAIVIGSEPSLAELPALEAAGVPVELRPIRLVPAFRNLHQREDYDRDIADTLLRLKIDYVLLAGYDYIVTAPLLSDFEGRVLALHHGELAYPGTHPVRDAILAGAAETRSTIYVVTREVARGPLLLMSGAFPLAPMALAAREHGDADFLVAYADLHRRWMAAEADGPMLIRALELLAGGTMQTIGDVVWVDGAPGPCRMGESPRECHEIESMLARGIPRSCPFIG